MATQLNLPIGVQAFGKIRTGGFYYVDKTPYLHQLIDEGSYYFLSRPRRFGKSLLLDTLKELFEANEPLFRGLYIHDRWDWQTRHPVIRLSFADGVMGSRQALDQHIEELLREHSERLGITLSNESIQGRFRELITGTHQQRGQRVVVLIDEYDKPILDNITDAVVARELREGLKNLYSVLKDADPHLKFCLLTGVSKFSKVSLFSGLNNLRDITLSRDYGAICGYTDEDIDTVFAPELPGLDRDQIRHWYNGYRWGDERLPSVYNPFDVLLLFQEREFRPYWFESATPTFLVKLLAERGLYTPRLDTLETEAALLGRFDVDEIATEALLFQTGYLTVHKVEQPMTGYWLYTLGYPNREVEASLNQALLPALGMPRAAQQRITLFRALQAHDLPALETHFKALFAGLPHDWYRNNPIAQYEGHYASVFYSHLAALGLAITVEDAGNTGRVDMTVDFNGHIYLFEFKVVEQVPEGKALRQLQDKGYADKYRGQGKPIHLIGVEFSREQRQIIAFDVLSL
ncbi:ATP-binding protein [Ectothiorhodospira lacustris]|uniref:ATP-binding protein n=1 Tax=Ectothiorhodospira lacustris TaxID=2899127 RepID=UPI001EE92729|nr:ATP-binding protein [Ectothiorhodospira lacustris]MCG5509492.1 ATP-binding protein [Ectothiorhodospira lacustris]MCG5521546.1 ATP-binding protein [Ectothiorhodospira lacustris]